MKVSFDFDMTLDNPNIRDYAKELVEKEYDVWIHTLRFKDSIYDPTKDWNYDLYEVAEEIGIPRDKIVFCGMADKWNFLKDDFTWHLDDDSIECDLINKNTKTIGICHFGNSTWKNKCNKLL